MTHAASWIAFVGLVVAMVACNHAFTEDATNYNLPIVSAAAPKHGFICTPTLTPRLGPIPRKELA